MKFSIVTPAYNSARFIGETIQSVITQSGDFSIEYLIMDNQSTDGTVEIVRDIQKKIETGEFRPSCKKVELSLVSQPDDGMYDAIERGFSHASGDIYAWINSDDFYLLGAFAAVEQTFSSLNEVSWLKGITSYCDKFSHIVSPGRCFHYRQDWIRAGVYGRETNFIQQDSVFWRSDLWKKSNKFPKQIRLAGDYALWIEFAKYSHLYSMPIPVSCFRRVSGQLSEDVEAYHQEMDRVCPVKVEDVARRRAYFARKRATRPWLHGLVEWLMTGKAYLHSVRFDKKRRPRAVSIPNYLFKEIQKSN